MARWTRSGVLLGGLAAAGIGIGLALLRGRRRRKAARPGMRPCGGAGREAFPNAMAGADGRLSADALVDEASEQSFPASDAPAYIAPCRVGRPAA